jgi:hypothetical protein
MARVSAVAAVSLLSACMDSYPAMGEPTPVVVDAGVRDAGKRDAGSTGSYVCPPPQGASSCGLCFNDSCCQELGALQNDGAALWECVLDCDGTASCQTSCSTRFPKLAPLLRDFNACGDKNCGRECLQ